jgi:hypothetical protein
MTDGVEHKEVEQADSEMIAQQLARVTLNMIHSLYGTDHARYQRMSGLILSAIPPALNAEIKGNQAVTRNSPWAHSQEIVRENMVGRAKITEFHGV